MDMDAKTVSTATILIGLLIASLVPVAQAESRGLTAGPGDVLQAHCHSRTDMDWERCWANRGGGSREFDTNEECHEGSLLCPNDCPDDGCPENDD